MALIVIPTYHITLGIGGVLRKRGGNYTASGTMAIDGVGSRVLIQVVAEYEFWLMSQFYTEADGTFTLNNLNNERYHIVALDPNGVKSSKATSFTPNTLQF